MARKLSLLLAAAAIAAFAVPAIASAAPELTIGGKAATAGQTLTATSVNATTQTSLGKLVCESVSVHSVVKLNNGTTVEAEDGPNSGNTKGTGRKLGAANIPVENVTLTKLHTSKVGSFTFSLDSKL